MNEYQIQQARKVKIGQLLTPDPLWNKNSRGLRLPEKVAVIDIAEGTRSQTGIMYYIQYTSGERGCLDAGWFAPSFPEHPDLFSINEHIDEEAFWKDFRRLEPGELLREGDVFSVKSNYRHREKVTYVRFTQPVPEPDETQFIYYRPLVNEK